MRNPLFSWMVLGTWIVLNSVQASEPEKETPGELPGGYIITSEEVRVLIEQGDVYLADCRSPFNYGKGHLPGARSLEYQLNYHTDGTAQPDGDESRINFDALPEDKTSILIFYSHGPTGWKSYRAAQAAIREGYSQVHWFRGGVKAWLAARQQLEY